jgi:hypothetical protein
MNELTTEGDVPTTESVIAPLCKVTPCLQKYLAMVIFILLPFVGGYVGYQLAPEREVELPVSQLVNVEKIAHIDEENQLIEGKSTFKTIHSNYTIGYNQNNEYLHILKSYLQPIVLTGTVVVRWNDYWEDWSVLFTANKSDDSFVSDQYGYGLLSVEGDEGAVNKQICLLVSCPLDPDEKVKATFSATTTLKMNLYRASKTLETGKEFSDLLYVGEVVPL